MPIRQHAVYGLVAEFIKSLSELRGKSRETLVDIYIDVIDKYCKANKVDPIIVLADIVQVVVSISARLQSRK